jgi:hypothetical protein
MPGSGIVDLAVGMAFVFGVTAALSSVVTELIARYLGLRGAFLLRGLRELLDGSQASTDLGTAEDSYHALKGFITGQQAATSARAAAAAEPANQQLQDAALAAEHAQVERTQPADRSSAEAATPGSAVPSATSALLGSPILRSQGMAGLVSGRKLTLTPPGKPGQLPKLAASSARRPWRLTRSLPSYIPARSFAEAVLDMVVPDADGQTTMTAVRAHVDALPDSMTAFKPALQALAKHAGNDMGAFRTSVEGWYDDHMDRVSGWYKRHIAKITLLVGAILVLLLNVNAITIGRTLYTDSAVSTAVSSVAAKNTACTPAEGVQKCVDNLQAQLSAATQAGLPIGWATIRDCTGPGARCNWLDQRGVFSRHGGSGWQAALVLIGFLLTIVALVPGARFWFGLLSKLGTLRSTGPKPAASAS